VTNAQITGQIVRPVVRRPSATLASRNKSAKCPPRFAGFLSGARGGLRRHNYSRLKYSRLKWATPPRGVGGAVRRIATSAIGASRWQKQSYSNQRKKSLECSVKFRTRWLTGNGHDARKRFWLPR
jgi:hypothetical protein